MLSSIAYLALTLRILIAVSTRTFFQPDEYFQALEPAHFLVYGYGHLTWEWRIAKPIRSILYPALNIPVLGLLKYTGLSEIKGAGPWATILSTKILHGALGAITDISSLKLARGYVGEDCALVTLFLSLSSFFNALSLSRSLVNSLETSLTSIAYTYYPWDASPHLSPHLIYHRSNFVRLVASSALACMIRPTNAVIWVFLYGHLFWSSRSSKRISFLMFNTLAFFTVLAVSIIILADSLFYGRLTLTPFNFLATNISNLSLFYGASPWHYYISQGLPILTTTALPFVAHGVRSSYSMRDTTLRTMSKAAAWTIGVYSLSGHKEWRFIHPILPLLYVLASKSIVDLAGGGSPRQPAPTKQKITPTKIKYPHRANTIHKTSSSIRIPVQILSTTSRLAIRKSHFVLLCLPIPAALYVVLFYCSAPITVMSYLRSLPSQELRGGIGFLMPCHSTPGHAYLHQPELVKSMWALGCEPPLDGQDLASYRDQTDVFFHNPRLYFEYYFPPSVNPEFPYSLRPISTPGQPAPVREVPQGVTDRSVKDDGVVGYPWSHEWPKRLVLFGTLLEQPAVKEVLLEKGYTEEWKRGREWEGEGKRKGGVRVWRWVGP